MSGDGSSSTDSGPGLVPGLRPPAARVPATKSTETHCPYCALQCGMTLVPRGDSWSVEARDFPTNRGGLCRKGWAAGGLLESGERLDRPLMRPSKGAPLREASWDAALHRIATGFHRTRQLHGADAVGVMGGGGLTNEKAYLLGKFARVALRSSSIDYNGRFCMSASALANLGAFGLDRGLPFPLEDLPHADLILLAGANPAETMPPLMQYFEAQAARGGKLVVVDPRRTPTAEQAQLHLQLAPGTDTALANGLLHLVIGAGGCDATFIAERTEGFAAVKRIVASYWPERVERITGVPEAALRRTAQLLAEASSVMVLSARGSEQQIHGVHNVYAYINLLLALGQAGRPHAGYGCLTGQGNGQGGREHGQKCDQLPGYRSLSDPIHRAVIGAVWGIPPDDLPACGPTACELFESIGREGGLRDLLVMGSNPLVSVPNAGALRTRFEALDLLVVADTFLSETAAAADVVLPVAHWAEDEGTVTNLEGRVLLRRRARLPPAGVWTDIQVLCALADRLGAGSGFPDRPQQIFDELRRASAGGVADYNGITYERIRDKDGIFWPCPSTRHPGTPRLFLERFATPDGKARFHPVQHEGPAEQPDAEFPYFLTTGRLLVHYQSGTQTRRVPELRDAEPEVHVELHPETARSLGIESGELVRLVTRRGVACARARPTASLRLDTVFLPFHWGGTGSANLLTNDARDAQAEMPEFKVCAVRLERLGTSSATENITQEAR